MRHVGYIFGSTLIALAMSLFVVAAVLLMPIAVLFTFGQQSEAAFNNLYRFFADLFHMPLDGAWLAFLFVFPAYAFFSGLAACVLLLLGEWVRKRSSGNRV